MQNFLTHPLLHPSNASTVSSDHKLTDNVPKHARIVLEDSDFPKLDEVLTVILESSQLNGVLQAKGMNYFYKYILLIYFNV